MTSSGAAAHTIGAQARSARAIALGSDDEAYDDATRRMRSDAMR
jgi:hypothetical protein